MKFTFLCFHKQFVLQKPLKHWTDVEEMFLEIVRKDEDVIEVKKDNMVEEV